MTPSSAHDLATAVELAAAVRTGTTTAVDATRAALARIESDDVGAFQLVRAERALAEAAAVDARADRSSLPLAGESARQGPSELSMALWMGTRDRERDKLLVPALKLGPRGHCTAQPLASPAGR